MILVTDRSSSWRELDLVDGLVEPTGDALTDADLALVTSQMVAAEVDWGFALVPDPALGIAGTAMVRWEAADDGETLDDVAERLVLPEQMLVGAPDVSRRPSPLGEALRLLQLKTTPASDLTETVTAHLLWAWLVDDVEDGPLLVTLSTSVHALELLDTVEAALDELAAGLTSRQG